MSKLTWQRIEEIAHQIKQERLSDIELYINLEPEVAQLDDWYTPEQLRRIADAIEELGKRVKELETDDNQT